MTRILGLLLLLALPVLAGPPHAAAQQGERYTATTLRLREAPSTDAATLATLPRASRVRVGLCANDWCEVEYRGLSGYSAERYLRTAPPARPVEHASGRGYINSRGEWVPSPRRSADGRIPAGASARCRDGTYSFSRSRRGTCSHHGGVAVWL